MKDYLRAKLILFSKLLPKKSYIISDKFIDKLAKCGVMEKAITLNAFKENSDFKKTDGIKFI